MVIDDIILSMIVIIDNPGVQTRNDQDDRSVYVLTINVIYFLFVLSHVHVYNYVNAD